MTVYSGPNRRLAFFNVVAAISDEGPGMAIGHHVGPKVAAIDMANCDSAAVAIDAPGFAGDVAFANQCAQVFGGSFPSRPSISARLATRTDSAKAGNAASARAAARTDSFIGFG